MDIQVITQLISALGFPIVCVGALGWFGYKVWLKSQEQNEKREERNYSMMDKFQSALDGFKLVLDKYADKLNAIESDVKDIKDTINK